MPSVIVTRAARADLVRLREFLRENNPKAAESFANALADVLDLLATSPRMGRPVTAAVGLHRLVVPFGAGGYVLHYRYASDRDGLHVLRIRHSREGA
ncbi:type II toxin-antitoxin system RelE/ParE family toxin [Laribacter hongkongensis]|uniref:type II toxin-antitoxin system RelE/ParE family toxin n=1 Tax=Laribacter hongkongensis TaxID=168471 RepID=UPI001EFD2780|nr:type II toxin-antitoxin system RelE/ParE family toxin [Laribacter hongkongensis]MCG9116995.1 type II toxin-antitoxin system RelE/ParE family toxin [Laribacter hongkongensis]